MNKNSNWKILQIIQAQAGWTAVHCQESKTHEITIFNRPIVCWAIVATVGNVAEARTEVRGVEQVSDRLGVVEDFIDGEKVEGSGYGRDRSHYFLGYNDPAAHKESDLLDQASE